MFSTALFTHIPGVEYDRFWLPHWADRSAGQCPFTVGGDTFTLNRIAALREAHFNQTDTSLNSRIWSIFPVDNTNYDDAAKLNDKLTDGWKTGFVHTYKSGGTDTAQRLAPQTIAHEKWRIHRNWLTLLLIPEYLEHHGYLDNPSDNKAPVPCTGCPQTKASVKRYATVVMPATKRKMDKTAEPLKDLVNRIVAKKTTATASHYNKGNYGAAAREYHSCLVELYPWINTPLIFTPTEAFATGVAQLENDLWVKLSICCLKLYFQTREHGFAGCAHECAGAIVAMRYTTHSFSAKAWKVMYETSIIDHMQENKPISSYLLPQYHPAVQGHDNLVQYLMVKAENPGDGSWAHAKCYHKHICGAPFQRHAEDMVNAEIKRRQARGGGGIIEVGGFTTLSSFHG